MKRSSKKTKRIVVAILLQYLSACRVLTPIILLARRFEYTHVLYSMHARMYTVYLTYFSYSLNLNSNEFLLVLIGTIVEESLLLRTCLVIVVCVLCINTWLF